MRAVTPSGAIMSSVGGWNVEARSSSEIRILCASSTTTGMPLLPEQQRRGEPDRTRAGNQNLGFLWSCVGVGHSPGPPAPVACLE